MNEINNTLVEETLTSLRRFAAIKSQINVAIEIDKAINTINYLQEQLELQTKLAQNGQSAIDTATRIADKLWQCRKERAVLIEKITDLIKNGCEDSCEHCKHYIKCEGEKCDKYIEGQGALDEKGNKVDFKWTCMDFNYGDCPKLDATPCYECIKNNLKGFEWKGID